MTYEHCSEGEERRNASEEGIGRGVRKKRKTKKHKMQMKRKREEKNREEKNIYPPQPHPQKLPREWCSVDQASTKPNTLIKRNPKVATIMVFYGSKMCKTPMLSSTSTQSLPREQCSENPACAKPDTLLSLNPKEFHGSKMRKT